MKLFKLIVHQKNFSGEDLIINPKDYPGIKTKDVVEIYHPEDEFSRLLLQVTVLKEDLQGRETISIENNIASMFQLKTFHDVYMNVVDPDNVALDSVELMFKDQYLGRSEMWRLKNSLVSTCVYMNKKIEHCNGSIRCQVYEMWAQGDRVACGVINKDTKIVFRSSTSMVYLFIQMSSEMWDFDIHGDLYFEKAVNGFLADLFQKWKKNGCNHEVTIVLFSRTFYDAPNKNACPAHMRQCLDVDYKGRVYEDFYRVAIQNERYEDWNNILVELRKLFTDYQKIVLEYHKRPNVVIPKATNSTAAQGNFLQVLNMSLNVFEKHYLDRSFDRTGQLSVVITPGVGVFEVDRDLTNVTKQRIIDNGVGSDLVCVGEQPLHAVPLLKFNNSAINVPDDYSMPHWINLSFYSDRKKQKPSTFVPRIKLPQQLSKKLKEIGSVKAILNEKVKLLQDEPQDLNPFFDYDAYDSQVFQMPSINSSNLCAAARTKKTSVICIETHNNAQALKLLKRKMSDPDIHHSLPDAHRSNLASNLTSRSAAISIPQRHENVPVASNDSTNEATANLSAVPRAMPKSDAMDNGLSPPVRPVIGSAGSPVNASINHNIHPQPATTTLRAVNTRPGRALINPFDPSHVTIKLTSNRRRWTAIFPKGPAGSLVQQHHFQANPIDRKQQRSEVQQNNRLLESRPSVYNTSMLGTSPAEPNQRAVTIGSTSSISCSASQTCFNEHSKSKGHRLNLPLPSNVDKKSNELTLLWGATGEQEWTPTLTTGVDWKSLTISACLPITTDYFPDKRSLQNDYVVSDYSLLPDAVGTDSRKPLTSLEIFKELIAQRLAQGFQLIVLPPNKNEIATPGSNSTPPISSNMRGRQTDSEHKEEQLLSIGRLFHKVSLSGNSISVTTYRPRHPYPPFNIDYKYRFQAPFHNTYGVSEVAFETEKLETYYWNHLDQYICSRGDIDSFPLYEDLKYWRFRVLLVPMHNQATKKILEDSPHCDIYTPLTSVEQTAMMDGFLRFIEGWLNKIRRPHPNKNWSPTALGGIPPRDPASHLIRRRHSTSLVSLTNQNNIVGSSPFRERLGSNRLPEKSRPRSGSKVMDRGRVSPASEAVLPLAIEQQQLQFEHLEISDENITAEVVKIKSNATVTEILDAMKQPQTGVGFLTQNPSLPNQTFVSADAVQWLNNHIEGGVTIDKAVNLLKIMIAEKLICHASGDYKVPFRLGFYLYYIVQDRDGQKPSDYSAPLNDLKSFQKEWIEVEMKAPKGWCEPQSNSSSSSLNNDNNDESNVPVFLRNNVYITDFADDHDRIPEKMYKRAYLDIDLNNKSDRVEWGHLKYQSVYKPDHSYELVVEWMAASGPIIADLMFIWQRKAQLCGIQMIPIPSDLLALPFTPKSDPLRGPIFIPLDTKCLIESDKIHLFEEFPKETYAQRLFLFQESILQRFGFIRCSVAGNENIHQYVHVTGNAFVLVPLKLNNRINPLEDYISLYVSGNNNDDPSMKERLGFLWSWNHTLSRKWKCSTTNTGDELFQRKIIQDFRHFCSNGNNRLKSFWDSCWELKERFYFQTQ